MHEKYVEVNDKKALYYEYGKLPVLNEATWQSVSVLSVANQLAGYCKGITEGIELASELDKEAVVKALNRLNEYYIPMLFAALKISTSSKIDEGE